MTRDVAAQAVHERLESLVATMSEPDVEAGWAALVAQLEPPVAPVVPLRRKPRSRRAIVLGVAAAILIGGSALAMVRHGGNDGQPAAVHPPSAVPGRAGHGPHIHPSLSGPPSTHRGQPPGSTGGHHQGGAGSTTGSTSSSDRSGGASSGDPTSHTTHHDSPNDTDHGTGNDVHGDNGQGNNTQGQDTQGDGSTGGSGNDQGSGGGQGSSNRGTHPTGGGEHPTGGGSDGGRGSGGQGQDGGQGSHG